MIIKYYYYLIEMKYSNTHMLATSARVMDCFGAGCDYQKYMLASFRFDLVEADKLRIDELIAAIKKLEAGVLSDYFWDGGHFQVNFDKNWVTFEHTIFGECEEYPVWKCPLDHYKVAVRGLRKFMDMPRQLGSELLVELPGI